MFNFPFLAIAVALYAAMAVVFAIDMNAPAVQMAMPSGANLTVSYGDGVVFVGLVLMFVEITKATRTGAASIIDHVLSVLVFVACLLLLVLASQFATAPFLLITMMTFIDVIAGFTVTIVASRRDVGIDRFN